MISHASFQEQVINNLVDWTADPLNDAIVPAAEIRESQYQGTEFTYPNIRVDVRTQVPEGAGNCRTKISIENFAVAGYSEGDSSLECERVCFQIGEAMFGAQLEDTPTPAQGPAWRTETVNLVQYNAPRRLTEKVWRGEVIFRCRVKETS